MQNIILNNGLNMRCKMKRTGNMKRRESKNLPPEKLYEILSKIYPDKVVDEIFPKLIKCEIVEKGGEE